MGLLSPMTPPSASRTPPQRFALGRKNDYQPEYAARTLSRNARPRASSMRFMS